MATVKAVSSVPGGFAQVGANDRISGHAGAARKAIADASYTITANDVYVALTSLTAARILTLPSASSYPVGQALTIADESGSCSATLTITIVDSGGTTTTVLNRAKAAVTLFSTGTAWALADPVNAAGQTLGEAGVMTVGVVGGTVGNSLITLNMTRGQISTLIIPFNGFRVAGFSTLGDLGRGTPYIRQQNQSAASGPLSVQSGAAVWYEIDTRDGVDIGWYGAALAPADSTVPINRALAASPIVRAPAGLFLTDGMTINSGINQGYMFLGAGMDRTIIRKRTATANNVLTLGANPSPTYVRFGMVADMTLDGLDKTATYAGLEAFDQWNFELLRVKAMRCQIGVELLTAIFANLRDCFLGEQSLANGNRIGLRVRSYGGASFPTAQPACINLWNTTIQYNSLRGIDFDDGTELNLLAGTAVEYNGTTAGPSGAYDGTAATAVNESCGILIGANVGRYTTGSTMRGLNIGAGAHVEGSRGLAEIVLLSGDNIIKDIQFFGNDTDARYDVLALGGRYTIRDCRTYSPKTTYGNVFDGPSVFAGNEVANFEGAVLKVNRDRTSVNGQRAGRGTRLRLSSGVSVPNNSETVIPWGVETFNPEGLHPSGNIERLVAPVGADRVVVTANVLCDTNGTGIRRLVIKKNGVEVAGIAVPALGYNYLSLSSGLIDVFITGGDYFTAHLYQNSGGTLNLISGQADGFSMHVVR